MKSGVSNKKKLLRILPKTIGILVLVWLLRKIGFSKPLSMIKTVGAGGFSFILILNFPHIALKTQRWRLLLKNNRKNYGFFKAFSAYFSGIAAGIATPGRSGEFVRALYPASDEGISLYVTFATVIADRFYDLIFLYLVSLAAIFLLFPIKVFGLTVLWSGVGFLFFFKFKDFIKLIFVESLSKFKIKSEKSEKFLFSLKRSFKTPLVPFVFSGLGYSIMAVQLYVLARITGIPVGFGELFVLMGLANTFALLPVSISGLGTREAAFGFLFSMAGYNVSDGILLSLMFFFSVSLPVTIVGVITLFFHKTK